VRQAIQHGCHGVSPSSAASGVVFRQTGSNDIQLSCISVRARSVPPTSPSPLRFVFRRGAGSQGSVGAFGFLEQSDEKIILVERARRGAVAIDISAVSCGDSA